MAVTCASVGSGQSTSSTGVSTSGSITPAVNKLYLAVVVSRAASSPNAPTISAAAGLSWVQILSRVDATNFRRITVFRAMKASGLSSGVVTATFGVQTQTVALISVLELDGIDITGTDGSGAIISPQAQNGSTTNAASPVTITMSAWADAVNNAAVASFWHGNAEVSTPKSGWTETSDQAGVSSTSLQTQFRLGQDTTPQMSFAGSSTSWGGIAVEIKAGAATVYNATPSGGLVLGGSVAQSKVYDDIEGGGIALGGSTVFSKAYTDTPSGGIVFTAGVGDPYTVLLLHADGADGSTSFIDSSLTPHAMTANGDVQVDTAQSKFSGASALFDGSGDDISTPDSADWDFGSGDFTIDCWVRFADVSAERGFVSQWASGDNAWRFGYHKFFGGLDFEWGGSVGGRVTPAWSPAANQWYHCAVVRTGNTLKHFVDGTQLGSNNTISGTVANSAQVLRVGLCDVDRMWGWIDELRISKGIARWTSNFTPPAAPYVVTPPSSSVAISWVRAPTPTGGIVLNGSCSSTLIAGVTYNQTPSGGIVLGGSVAQDITRDKAVSGGIILGGTVVQSVSKDSTLSGGLVLGGSAPNTKIYDTAGITLPGGHVLNGTCTSSLSTANGYTDNPIGGLVLGGSVSVARTFGPTPSGGLVLGGSVVVDRQLALAQGGGLVLGGSCVTTTAASYTVTPSGGIQLGGSATSDRALALSRSGGLVLGGTVVSDIARAKAPSAGIILGGSTITTIARAFSQGGGIVLNGSCASSFGSPVYNLTPSGGIILGGAAQIGSIISIFPVSDLTDGGWTDQVGGHNLYAAVDEVIADDADYIKSAPPPGAADICEVRFLPQYDPLSSTGHALVYRYGSDAEGWTTVTQTLTGAQADAITNYGALGVRFESLV